MGFVCVTGVALVYVCTHPCSFFSLRRMSGGRDGT